MSINISQLAPFIWILAAILVVVIAVALIRFFWRHVLKVALHGCAVIVVIVVILAVLSYFKIIRIF